jgi:hypothetical protein
MGPPAIAALALLTTTNARAVAILRAMRGDLSQRATAMIGALNADAPVWRNARGPMQALIDELQTPAALLSWLDAVPQTNRRASLRALSIASNAAHDATTRALISQRALAIETAEFSEQFLRLSALGGSPEGRRELAHVLHDHADDDLRDEAARVLVALSDTMPEVHAELRLALDDETPRVRVTALRGLHADRDARTLIERRLQSDSWPSVRAAAAEALTGDPLAMAALFAALDDNSVIVVRAALNTLALTPQIAAGPRLLAFVRDSHRNPELRVEALAAIGQRCDRTLVADLEALVVDRVDPALPESEQRVGHAALSTIARLDPARARVFLQRMDGNQFAIAAVERATQRACSATR